MAETSVNAVANSTAQQLASVIKSARDIMRKDKGLSGELDRLPMLTWVMFLKFLDDMEQVRETEAALAGQRFVAAIEPPYRWRDWAGRPDGITGDALIAFINQDEAVRPDGSRGPGLFAYLRSLQGSDGADRRYVVATVFRGTVNRMINGYLLRDVLNKINSIHFTSSDEVHTLSLLYESVLKEMRDAAGDSGEFYTPRPVVQFITAVVDPRLGETVLDPAAGTGGFLVAAFEHLKRQCRKVEDYERLQRDTLYGVEAKPLPYLLCEMNLLLHGLDTPNIDPDNALRFPLREIGDRDRVDVIMTNPPFGGEEERGILGNFPEDRQTSETALLFLQLIMRKLRRPVSSRKGGRCGMVVPNGVLFGDGVCARIKEELLKEFNLHSIVRLPKGVFAPYTDIETNLLFFQRPGPTKEIWYYEHPLPEGRKNYTKTKPLRFEEFAETLQWWRKREENGHAWKVSVNDVLKYDESRSIASANLDIKNPRTRDDFAHRPPERLVEEIITREQRIVEIMAEIKRALAKADE
jgi:type I restriction enzyme M protein